MAFWTYPTKGWQWSLFAGTLGAIGALGVLLAFGQRQANCCLCARHHVHHLRGRHIVNAIVSTSKRKTGPIKLPFIAGICLAALGESCHQTRAQAAQVSACSGS